MRELDTVILTKTFTPSDGPVLPAGSLGAVLRVYADAAMVEIVDQATGQTLGLPVLPFDVLQPA